MNFKNFTDHAGIIAACMCVFHCVALPVLLITSSMSSSDNFHVWSLAFTVVVTGHALWHGYNYHCKHIILTLGGLGLVSLLGGVVMHFMFHEHPPSFSSHVVVQHDESMLYAYGEQAATIIGSLLLISSHLYNLKFKRECCNTKHD